VASRTAIAGELLSGWQRICRGSKRLLYRWPELIVQAHPDGIDRELSYWSEVRECQVILKPSVALGRRSANDNSVEDVSADDVSVDDVSVDDVSVDYRTSKQ
jgi:hypothetical protein